MPRFVLLVSSIISESFLTVWNALSCLHPNGTALHLYWCLRTTLQNHKWHWTLMLSFYYCFFHPAVKATAFIDNYLNPACKLSLICIYKFPMLCNTSAYCADQNFDCSHECYQTSYQGFPHSKHLIIYPKFWTFGPGMIFCVPEFNYMGFFTEQLDNKHHIGWFYTCSTFLSHIQ